MLQLIDLAKENAALRLELQRVREEAKRLRLLVDEYTNPDEAAPRFRQATTLAGMEE